MGLTLPRQGKARQGKARIYLRMTEEVRKHLYTPEAKLEWFGEGPWVDEPDLLEFTHNGIECRIIRVISKDGPNHVFGGHLCGYICLPKESKYYGKAYDDIPIEVHGGLTFGQNGDVGQWIGFDCAHSVDVVPSMIKNKNEIIDKCIKDYPHLAKSRIFEDSYKQIYFVIQECKSMADQLIALDNSSEPIV